MLQHLVLHVDLVRLVSGEGGIEAGEVTIGEHRFQFLAIEKVGSRTAFAKEEPVAPGVAKRPPFVQKAAKRRDARAGTDHDDRRGSIWRKAKFVVRLDVNRQSLADGNAVAKQR